MTLRIMLCGKSRFGVETYRALRDLPGVEIVAGAVSATRSEDKLRLALEGAGLPTVPLHHLRRTATAAFVREHGVDLIILANVTTRLNGIVRKAARREALCFHPSPLPAFRGRDAVRDQVEAGVTRSGVSIFIPTEGWDEGPILKTAVCDVPAGITPSALYHEYLVPLGVEAMIAAVEAVRDGFAVYAPQWTPLNAARVAAD